MTSTNLIKNSLSKILFFLLFAEAINAQSGILNPLNVYNGRVYPSNVNQSEVFITGNNSYPNLFFAAANTITFSPSFFLSEGVYTSTDKGVTWTGSDTCNGPAISLHGGDPGIAIDKSGTFILTHLGRRPFTGLYSHYSTDQGKNWSSQKSVTQDDLERATTITDNNPLSPYYGRTYTSWVQFAPPYPLYLSYSDDGAKNWSPQSQINNPSQRCAGGDLAMSQNGTLYLTWAGVAAASPFSENYAGFAKSTNGGATWQVTENAFSFNGIQGVLTQKGGIRVNSTPRMDIDRTNGQFSGRIYIVTTSKGVAPAGTDPDIILARSTDNGVSWLPLVKVNTDNLNNGKMQFFPVVHVDNSGGVNIVFYDDRNTSSDSATVVLARSTNGGDSFIEYALSNHNFKPQPIAGLAQGYQGDAISITSTSDMLLPVWMDNSTNIYQLWLARVPLSAVSVNQGIENRKDISSSLSQNFPNPVSISQIGSTRIRFVIQNSSNVTLEVFNVYGQKIETIVSGLLSQGSHEAKFTPKGYLPSGIYFYRLTTNGFAQTKAMVIVK